MRLSPLTHAGVLLFLVIWQLASPRLSHAQITLDGTLGPAGALPGPDYAIPQSLGRTIGPNLFHSFRDFNLAQDEAATFSGSNSIANILSRVTGGNPSSIDGRLASTIPGVNFFFVNPNGVLFGPNAHVDVGGAFVASTADFVRLKDGGVFHARNPSASTLTSAPPAAFGFLNTQPAVIRNDGGSLSVTAGRSLSLIGGDVQLNGGVLAAPQGTVNVVSVRSTGEAALDATAPASTAQLQSFSQLGTITLQESAITVQDADDGSPGSSGGAGGNVVVRGGNLTLDNSFILARNTGTTTGGSIDVGLRGALQLGHQSEVATTTDGSGHGAAIRIKADTVLLEANSLLRAETDAGGAGGNITVEARSLQAMNGGGAFTNTFGSGPGGSITVKAGTINFQGQNPDVATGLATETNGGKGGSITVEAGTLHVLNGAGITTDTYGSGASGNVSVKADTTVVIDGQGSSRFTGLSAGTAVAESTGIGGSIQVESDTLHILNGGVISTGTNGSGAGGNISVKARTTRIEGRDNPSTGITAVTFAETNGGKAGNVTLEGDSLHVLNGGIINTNTFGSGEGGSISIEAQSVLLDGQGSAHDTSITADTGAATNGGKGGSVNVESDSLQILNGGEIATNTFGNGEGGGISIETRTLRIDAQGNVHKFTGINATTFSENQGGAGGNINVNSDAIQIANGGLIAANTVGSGVGGSIAVTANALIIDGQEAPRDAQGNPLLTGLSATTDMAVNGGAGGSIQVTGNDLQILNGGAITASTFGSGAGGSISIKTQSMLLDGQGSAHDTSITADTRAATNGGKGGSVNVESDSLQILNGGEIATNTFGNGEGGGIAIETGTLRIDAQGNSHKFTGINATTFSENQGGAGGSINVSSGDIQVANGGLIAANTVGSGVGGGIAIKTNTLRIDGQEAPRDAQGNPHLTGLSATTDMAVNGGAGGSIQVTGNDIQILNGGAITASTFGSGKGGDIKVQSQMVSLDSGASIQVDSTGSGDAGSITLQADDSVNLSGSSTILASAPDSNGGNIQISAGTGVHLRDSSISSLAGRNGGSIQLNAGQIVFLRNSELNAKAGDNGGNITLDPRFMILDRSRLIADAVRGNGGNITIRANVFLPSVESLISASSQFGVAGNIRVESPNTNVGGSLVNLAASPLTAESYLQERCQLRRGLSSSLTVNRQAGVPPDPSGLLPSVGVK